jgi:hypothetical protein
MRCWGCFLTQFFFQIIGFSKNARIMKVLKFYLQKSILTTKNTILNIHY